MRQLALFAVFTSVLGGCSSSPKGEVSTAVEGTVQLDGAPLKEGKISFAANDGYPPVSAEIHDGRYSINVRPGDKRVQIIATQMVVPTNPPGMESEVREPVPMNYLPERYNANTELQAEVTLEGSNQFDFQLTSGW